MKNLLNPREQRNPLPVIMQKSPHIRKKTGSARTQSLPIKMKVKTVTAKLQCMAERDIVKHIPTKVLEQIKQKDRHPLFQAFVLGHEGDSFPRVVGRESGAIMRWLTDGVKAIYEKLKEKTKVFFNHIGDNSHNGRILIGELVGKALDTINGKLHTIGIIYRYPQYSNLETDIASIETDVNAPDDFTTLEVDQFNVGEITGIALASKENEKPAFPGATLQAAVQFLQENEKEKTNKPKEEKKKMDEDKPIITLKQIMDFINSNKVLPTQLFTIPRILEDQQVMGHITGHYVVKETHDETVKKLTTEKDGYKGKLDRIDIDKIVTTAIEERKIDNKNLEKFLFDNIQYFTREDNGKSLKVQLDAYLNTQIEQFNTYFPKEDKKDDTTGNGDGDSGDNEESKKEGVGPSDSDGKTGGVDYTDPKNNPFIGE